MILGVNGIRLVVKRSGVGRCIEAILSCMGRMEHPFRDIRVYTPTPLPKDVVLHAPARNVVLSSRWPLAIWEQLTLPRAHGHQNVLLCPSYVIPFFARCPTLLIHHGSYEGYPQAFSWWDLNKARVAYSISARLATVVTTVSEHSKRDMVRFYGINPERVHVVPEGVDTTLFRHIDNQKRLKEWRVRVLGSDTPYIVYVSKPTERRNLSSLIKAFSLLKKQDGVPHKLLIVGAELPGTSLFRQVIMSEGLSEQVVVVGYADHREMGLVYNAAGVRVY